MKKLCFLPGILIVVLAILMSNCSKELPVSSNSDPEIANFKESESANFKKGKKIVNPYTTKRMETARQTLLDEGQVDGNLLNEIQIKTTDLYVKFKIKSADEYDKLATEDELELFPYPLDYDYGDVHGVIVDPEAGEKPEWLYTVVKPDYNFSSIHYKIIDELFLPESYFKDYPTKDHLFDAIYLVEEKSFVLTDTKYDRKKEKATSAVFPEGYIKVWNTVIESREPVVKVKVRGRRFFTYGYDFTDATGYYKLDEDYNGTVHYSVVLENEEGFKIWGDLAFLSPAVYEFGTASEDGKDLDAWHSLQIWRWAATNNAALDYYDYCDDNNITSPPSDLRIWVFNGSSEQGSAGMFRHLFADGWTDPADIVENYLDGFGVGILLIDDLISLVTPDITITVEQDVTSSEKTYELVTHECSHAGHYNKVGKTFWANFVIAEVANMADDDGYPYGEGTEGHAGLVRLSEGWAFHTGMSMTLDKYGIAPYLDSETVYENYTPIALGDETDYINYYANGDQINGWIPFGLFYDLIDTNVDLLRSTYYDNASGYNIQKIFNAMDSDVDSMSDFKSRLLSENSNLDYTDVNTLFTAYY